MDFIPSEELPVDDEQIILRCQMGSSIDDITTNFCYDRDFCERKGIDYHGKNIYKEVKKYVIEVLKSWENWMENRNPRKTIKPATSQANIPG